MTILTLKKLSPNRRKKYKNELTDKIENNSKQLHKITVENQYLKKENETLKSRMEALEQNQLTNNVMLTGVQEGPFEPYSTAKLRVHEMIAATITSGNSEDNLNMAQKVYITNCNRVSKFRHNYSRPISITFAKRDDKSYSCQIKGICQREFLQTKSILYTSNEIETDYNPSYNLPNPSHTMRINANSYKIDWSLMVLHIKWMTSQIYPQTRLLIKLQKKQTTHI